jgi:hypothetical protein
MEVTYDGALVMPSNCVMMDEEEMTYLTGGGTITVKASKETVRAICRGGVGLIGTAIGAAFGGPILANLLSGGLATLIYDYIIDKCNVKYVAIKKTWTKDWLPTQTFNLDDYV